LHDLHGPVGEHVVVDALEHHSGSGGFLTAELIPSEEVELGALES
jgi:hypothetical protein